MIAYHSVLDEPYFGSGPAAKRVQSFVELAAASQCAVLLLGESGTGKGVTAFQIHRGGSRRRHPFVNINCAGLGGALLKSELFGHTKGAFTGAICDHAGLIEEANGGTLFLDEIGDMDIDVQCQILKAIEEKSFRRLGENKLRTSDFRLICATNRDISKAMESGAFREDLFYRINTLMLRLPSLIERQDDIPGFLDYLLKKMGYAHFPVCDSVAGALMRRRWRGNIRELSNTIERAFTVARGGRLTIEHFDETSAEIPKALAEAHPDLAAQRTGVGIAVKNIWNIDELESAHIRHALKFFDNDKHKTCKALGISISSLYRKMENIRRKEIDRVSS